MMAASKRLVARRPCPRMSSRLPPMAVCCKGPTRQAAGWLGLWGTNDRTKRHSGMKTQGCCNSATSERRVVELMIAILNTLSPVIASEAKQSGATEKNWIASSLSLLVMTIGPLLAMTDDVAVAPLRQRFAFVAGNDGLRSGKPLRRSLHLTARMSGWRAPRLVCSQNGGGMCG